MLRKTAALMACLGALLGLVAGAGSAAAQGKKDGEPQPLTAEQMAFAQLTQGIHW